MSNKEIPLLLLLLNFLLFSISMVGSIIALFVYNNYPLWLILVTLGGGLALRIDYKYWQLNKRGYYYMNNKELVERLIENAEVGRYCGSDYLEAAERITALDAMQFMGGGKSELVGKIVKDFLDDYLMENGMSNKHET